MAGCQHKDLPCLPKGPPPVADPAAEPAEQLPGPAGGLAAARHARQGQGLHRRQAGREGRGGRGGGQRGGGRHQRQEDYGSHHGRGRREREREANVYFAYLNDKYINQC